MIDAFAFTHQQVRRAGALHALPGYLFTNDLRVVGEMTLPWRWASILEATSIARAYVGHFMMIVEEMLLPFGVRHIIDRLLQEVVALHRLQAHIVNQRIQLRRFGRCIPILGAMIQQRLSLVLASVVEAQHQILFELGRRIGYDRMEWENAFVGAAACARTIMAFCHIRDCEVFLPSIHEDVDDGIDLFIRYGPVELAVDVKSGFVTTGLDAIVLAERPTDTEDERTSTRRQRFFDKVRRFNVDHDTGFVPVVVRVGRPNGGRYDLTLRRGEVSVLEDAVLSAWPEPSPSLLKAQPSP